MTFIKYFGSLKFGSSREFVGKIDPHNYFSCHFPSKKLGDFFFDDNVAVPIVDLIIHYSHIFMMEMKSIGLN